MPRRNLILVIALLAVAAGLVLLSREPPGQKTGPLEDSLGRIRDSYYRPIDEDELRRGALEGMVDKLDPFSAYIPPGKKVAIEQRLQGWESGLGLRLEIVDGQVVVIGPIRGSPSDRANLYTGDRIVAVDGAPVAGLDLTGVYRKLGGKVGSTVRLTVFRVAGGEEGLTLIRRKFRIETITGLHRDRTREWIHLVAPEEGIAYVRVREFVVDTASRLQQCLRQLAEFRALVLDLRDNPGGPLESAVAVSDLFLDEGTIVSVVGRERPPVTYRASADGTYPPKIPVVVLVNPQTASAAELVAGALHLYDRAVLVGRRTHGKGSIQSMLDFGPLGQVNLTVSEFRIGGTKLISRRKGSNSWGVDPHEQVVILPSFAEKLSRLRVEAEVCRPPPTTSAAEMPLEGPGSLADQMMKLDLQLARAMEILRSTGEYQAILKRAAAARAAQAKLPPSGDQL